MRKSEIKHIYLIRPKANKYYAFLAGFANGRITHPNTTADLRRRKPPNIPVFQLIEFIELLFYHHRFSLQYGS